MKSRIALLVFLVVVTGIHLALFFGARKPGGETKEEDESPAVAVEEKEDSPPAEAPGESSPPPKEEAPPEKPDDGDPTSGDAVAKAVEAVKGGEKEKATAPGKAEVVDEPARLRRAQPVTEELPEGAMTVGLVQGQSKLSPELAEMAQEGTLAVAAQDWKTAREKFLELVQAAPDNALAYANLGVAEYQLGNLLAASGNLRKSLELNPSIARNWQTLGLIQYERDELELAISSLSRAIHEAPSDARSRLYLAAVIRDYGWTEAAVTELQRAIETDPKLAEAHYNLAVTYLETHPPRLELARRHYYAAIDLGAEPSDEVESALAAEED